MPNEHEHFWLTESPDAKAFRSRLLKEPDYLAEIDQALQDFREGKSKSLEEAPASPKSMPSILSKLKALGGRI